MTVEALLNAINFFAVIVFALLVIVGVIFNMLVRKRQLVLNGWSDIDVQLKRRANLIPQLVGAVEGYAAHERKLFEEIAERRSAALAAGDDPDERAAAETALAHPVRRMIAVAEDYPDLKANENFLDLQRQLAETEDKIEMARRFYNGAVRELNTMIASVPSNFVAGVFDFTPRAYFEIDPADRAAPSISGETQQ